MKCDDCGKEKADAEEVNCPYDEDINNEISKCILCEECYHERCMDI